MCSTLLVFSYYTPLKSVFRTEGSLGSIYSLPFSVGKTKHREVKRFDEGHVISDGYDSGLPTPVLSPD